MILFTSGTDWPHQSPPSHASAASAEEGDEIPAAMAQDSGLELIELD